MYLFVKHNADPANNIIKFVYVVRSIIIEHHIVKKLQYKRTKTTTNQILKKTRLIERTSLKTSFYYSISTYINYYSLTHSFTD